MRRKVLWFGLGILLVAGVIFVWQSLTPQATEAKKTSLIGEQYELPNLGFAQVEGDYTWDFPADRASHPEYQREEWFFQTDAGCIYTLDLSLRSLHILPNRLPLERDSAWTFTQVMTAELRLTEGNKVLFADVLDSRVAQDLAGANDERIWVENWVFDYPNQEFTITGSTLQADFALTLTNPEPRSSTEEWYAYQQSGDITGSMIIDGETYGLSCGINFTHRFGTAS